MKVNCIWTKKIRNIKDCPESQIKIKEIIIQWIQIDKEKGIQQPCLEEMFFKQDMIITIRILHKLKTRKSNIRIKTIFQTSKKIKIIPKKTKYFQKD